MKDLQFGRLLAILGLLSITFFTACNTEDEPPIIPNDSDPSIILISPSQNYSLNRRTETVSINFRMDDNEQLNAFWATYTWVSNAGNVYIHDKTTLVTETALSGNNHIETVEYDIPVASIQDYSTVKVWAFVRDNKGKVDSASFSINILPDPGMDTSLYVIQEYVDREDTIFTVLTGTKQYFSFINRTNIVPIAADRDIGEVSSGSFSAMLNAPNQAGKDSIFVVTSPAVFNFDSLSYQTVWQAFITSSAIPDVAGPLSAGDIVIVKMFNDPHYAIMSIKEVNTSMGAIIFTYKYTYL